MHTLSTPDLRPPLASTVCVCVCLLCDVLSPTALSSCSPGAWHRISTKVEGCVCVCVKGEGFHLVCATVGRPHRHIKSSKRHFFMTTQTSGGEVVCKSASYSPARPSFSVECSQIFCSCFRGRGALMVNFAEGQQHGIHLLCGGWGTMHVLPLVATRGREWASKNMFFKKKSNEDGGDLSVLKSGDCDYVCFSHILYRWLCVVMSFCK